MRSAFLLAKEKSQKSDQLLTIFSFFKTNFMGILANEVIKMKIVAVQKDEKGVIQQYKLENDRVVGVKQAIQMVKNNEIENCNVFTTRSGSEAIRSNNDGDPSNNLDNLPTFN